MWFEALTLAASVVAGSIASIAGFGIGSVLTPVFGLRVATNVAVAAVSVPHVVGTAVRFWLLRGKVDRRVLITFGLTSAAGGLTGALLQRWTSSPWLTVLFGSLLVFTSISEFSGLSRRLRFHGAIARIAGALSGMLGGLVASATVGVAIGTLIGRRALARIPETRFRSFVAALITVLGTAMIVKGFLS